MNIAWPTERCSCAGSANSHLIEPSLSGLVELGARLAGLPSAQTGRLAVTLLAGSGSHGWCSSLNNDGSPLQVSVSLSGRGARPAVRFIADPAAEEADGPQRWHRAGGVLSAILESCAPGLKPLCDSVVEHNLPPEPASRAALPSGAVWLGADLSGQGMALYATAKWGDHSQRWMRAQRWLGEILPPGSAAQETLDRLATRAVLVSVGVEGVTPRDARAKLYWRLAGSVGLRDLGFSLFDCPAFADFLAEVLEDRRIPLAGIVGSIGFGLDSGRVSDVKLDVCGHCVRRSPADWMRAINRLIARHELVRLPVGGPTLLETAELAFIGLGLDSAWAPRLNVYLKRCRL